VDEVILGNVLSAGLGLKPRRASRSSRAGCRKRFRSTAVNKACGSGLKAVALAAQSILLGDADIIVAGGMESMSGAPYILKKARFGVRMGHDQLLDSMIADGLTCPITLVHMGITAENIAAKYGSRARSRTSSRAESQQRPARRSRSGKFKARSSRSRCPARRRARRSSSTPTSTRGRDTKKECSRSSDPRSSRTAAR
jgi:acetyl-CoA C-acetyltransferase